MAFTKIVPAGINTGGSYTLQDLDVVGVLTASSFSGPLTGDATGLTGTPDVTVGAITAASADFSGNVSIAGTLTYEDVTNIDSVGLITARDGIIVTGGSVGIGTDNPTAPLHISGADSANAKIKIEDNNNGFAASEINIANGGRDLRIAAPQDIYFQDVDTGEKHLYIESGGNIGINTTTPSAKLDVMSAGNFTVDGDTFDGVSLMIRNDGGTQGDGNYGSAIAFTQIGNSGVAGYRAAITSVQTGADSDQLGLAFLTHPSVTGGDDLSEALRITHNRNLLINSISNDGTSNGGQTPALYVNGYSNLGGLRIRGLDAGNTIYKEGDDISIAVGTAHTVRIKTNGSERLIIDSNGKIQINNTTPTLELNGTSSNATASANLLWNLRDGNSNDYDVVKITGQNNGNGGYGELTVQTAYNNTLKDRIVVSSAGISSFIGYTANTDVLRVHDGTVEINDSLNQNNWQLQITNSNNSFTTGNSLIRAEYTGTNSSSNIKVFSGYVTSESAETCYIAGNGQFHGRGITGERDSASILGKYHSTGGATIDLTALTSNTWSILEIFGFVNPNSGGSNYEDPLHMYVYNGRGYNGNVVQYIYTQHIAPPARDIFPTGSGHSGNIVDAVWYNGSTESDYCPSQSSGHYVRLKCYNYNSTHGSSFNVRYFIRR